MRSEKGYLIVKYIITKSEKGEDLFYSKDKPGYFKISDLFDNLVITHDQIANMKKNPEKEYMFPLNSDKILVFHSDYNQLTTLTVSLSHHEPKLKTL